MNDDNESYDPTITELWQLSELHRRGSLSDEEFIIAKQELIGGINPWRPFISGLLIGGGLVGLISLIFWPSYSLENTKPVETTNGTDIKPDNKAVFTVDVTDPSEGLSPEASLRALSVYDLNGYVFHQVPAGLFYMDDASFHVNSFFIGATEVTEAFYNEIMTPEDNGSTYPVRNISWYDAAEFTNRLSIKSGLSPCYNFSDTLVLWPSECSGYRLPTEIEWAYAARAGEPASYAGGGEPTLLAWFRGNSEQRVHPVAQLGANSLGLYDMSGNVAEWVWDWHEGERGEWLGQARGPLTGENRTIRGGHFESRVSEVTIDSRDHLAPDIKSLTVGFRLARTVLPPQ